MLPLSNQQQTSQQTGQQGQQSQSQQPVQVCFAVVSKHLVLPTLM